MSEAIAEAETETSTVSTPDSEVSQESVLTQDAPPADTGPETPDTGTKEATSRTPDSFDLPELDTLYREGKLTDPALVSRRETLGQSYRDRQAQERDNLARLQQEEDTRLQQLTTAKDEAATKLRGIRERAAKRASEGLLDDEAATFYAKEEQDALDKYHNEARAIHLAPIESGLSRALISIVGDSVQNRRAVGAMSLDEKLAELYNQGVQVGKRQGPSDDYMVKTKAEYKADVDKALDEFKSTIPGYAPPRTDGTRAVPGHAMTLAEIDAMPTDEWLNLGDSEYRAQILADARIRGRQL